MNVYCQVRRNNYVERRQMYVSSADLVSAARTVVISASIGYQEGF